MRRTPSFVPYVNRFFGRATASDLGAALAVESVAVVSGLARGIDAAAHRGVRSVDGSGRPIAVVGSGTDVHYPKPNADLWEWVASDGLWYPPEQHPDYRGESPVERTSAIGLGSSA